MCDSVCVQMSECGEYLSEDVPGGAFCELFCLVDESEEFSVFFYFHDVVEDSLYFSICGAVDSSHIEVDDLNDITVSGLMGHFHLV